MIMDIKVVTKNGELEEFDSRRIRNKLQDETGLSKDEVDKITSSVLKTIKKNFEEEISASSIRSLINAQLIKRGLHDEEIKSRKIGMSVAEFEDLLNNGCKDNANISFSPEMISKYAYDSIAKEYALLNMPEECAEAHKQGLIHIHDLEYYNTRPNCLSGNNKIIVKDSQGVVSYMKIDEFVEKWQSDMEDYYVPSFNENTCAMEWNKVENAYKSSDKEQVYSVKFNKGYRIECTSDHKFIKSHNNKPCGDYDVKVSEFDNYKDLRLINLTDIHHYNDDNDYQKSALFGLFLGDGSISKSGAVKFSFSKTDKAEYCDDLLKNLGLEYSYNVYKDDNYQNGLRHDFYIIDRIYPNKSKSQLIYYFKNQLNLKGVFEGLVNSDGCVILDKNNIIRCNFTSTNKDIFDLYHLCLISLGLRGSISIHKPTNDNHNISYNSSTFGSKLIDLLGEITLRDIFREYCRQANKKCKQYQEISEITPKSIEYIGEMPVYNLTIENNHNYLAGVDGFILTQNCMNYDLRFFARNGLKIDGKGDMGSVAKPAKSLEVLLNHMLQAWMAGATVFSGGQGYVNFNTFLAPFCRGRTYEEIKQAIQMFIFNCNMSLICRGGQVLFSSIALDLSVPEVLADEPAISFGGVSLGTYKDYQEEADLIFRAVCEVSNEKDGEGAWHRFPNILFNIREGDLEEYNGTCKLLHETGANNPTIYYNNCIDIERSTMGCFSGDTKLHFWYDGKHYFETFSFIDKLINADYGVNNVNGFKILGLVDDEDTYWKNGEEVKSSSKAVEYVEALNFIKNRNRKIYHIILEDGNEFDCDDTHSMIECDSYQKVGVYEAFVNHLKICNIIKEPMSDKEGYFLTLSETYIKDIVSMDKYEDTYCFEADGTIIVDEFILTGNCRSSLPMNYRGNYKEDCVNTGNFMYNTINLPLIALEVDGDIDKFYEKLDNVCEVCYTSLLHRRETVIDVIYNKHMSDFLLQEDKDTGEPLWSIDRTTITLGYCGLNECVMVLNGKDITDDESMSIGVDIIRFINKKKNEFFERDGLRWSVIASPAESTSFRFAKINREKYPDCPVQGTGDRIYLTNSHHIPVGSSVDWIEHIRNSGEFAHLSLGGDILHIWSGEVWSDAEAIWKLNKRIIEYANPIFWAYSKVFTFCRDCQFTINDKLEVCPVCLSRNLRVFDRVTGYYLPIDTFNDGKVQEFEDRHRHKLT